MLKKPKLKTTYSKGLLIFSLVGLILSIAMILIFALTEQDFAFQLVVYVFCSIFIVVALILILTQLGNYVEANDTYLYSSILFSKKRIKITKIEEIEYKNEIYIVYYKGHRKFATINSFDPNANFIITHLEKKGIKIK